MLCWSMTLMSFRFFRLCCGKLGNKWLQSQLRHWNTCMLVCCHCGVLVVWHWTDKPASLATFALLLRFSSFTFLVVFNLPSQHIQPSKCSEKDLAGRQTWQGGFSCRERGSVCGTLHALTWVCMWWWRGREFSVGTGRQLCREFKQLTEDETLAAERTSGVTRHIKKATSV